MGEKRSRLEGHRVCRNNFILHVKHISEIREWLAYFSRVRSDYTVVCKKLVVYLSLRFGMIKKRNRSEMVEVTGMDGTVLCCYFKI